MDVKNLFLSATLVVTVGSSGAIAADTFEYRMETIAPTVTQASCTEGCDQGESYCDSAGGGLLERFGLGSCADGCEGVCGLGGCAPAGVCDSAGGCDCGVSGGCGCNSFCSGGCEEACGKCDSGLFGYGLIKQSDHCFDDFISPMTNPVFFEDPRTLSEVRFIFLNHELPTALGGNSVQVYAMQVRAALTKRLSLIATKDGLIYTQSPVLDSGIADIAAGLKYNLYRDVQNGRLLSVGGTFEVPSGSKKSLQGNGNGEFHFFATAGTRLGSKAHWLIASGIREPADRNLENGMIYLSNHLDRQVGNRPLYVFTELNWYNYTSSGNAFPLPIEGGDLFNLGSPGITGNDLVTNAIGMKAKPRSNMEAGIAWEYPMTARQGLMANRLTADLIIRY